MKPFRRSFLVLIAALSTAYGSEVQADCVMRTTALTTVQGKIDDIGDYVPMVGPAPNNQRECSISARVQYKGQWYTAYGKYAGPATIGDQELCLNALEIGVRQFLASKETKVVVNDQQMVCSDEPEIKIRPVQIGEVIHKSEVLPDPDHLLYFYNKGIPCKWFVEASGSGTDYRKWKGIICKTGRKDSDEWLVVDKF
jgi:hypothetical protein